ncbi:MAG: cyclase family protein, partial [Chloroflexota bacterium]
MSRKVIDLTLPFVDGQRGVALEPELNILENGFNTTTLHIYSHALTHMDAPKHFIDGGAGIETIRLADCVGSAQVIDLSYKAPN